MSFPIPHVPAKGQQYRKTTSFIYLGGVISERPKLSAEIDRRIRAGWMSFNRYRAELYDRPTASLEVVEALLYVDLRDAHHRMLFRIL